MGRLAPLLRRRRRAAGTDGGASDATRTRRIAATVLFLSFLDVFALLPTVAPHAAGLGAGPAMLGLVVGAYSAPTRRRTSSAACSWTGSGGALSRSWASHWRW